MTITLLRGDALHLPVASRSVDLIVTSPPYFALRSYQDGGVHYPGQLGDEATPAEFVDALLAATREMMRVLVPGGNIWVNLGDKYSQYEGSRKGHGRSVNGLRGRAERVERGNPLDMPVNAPGQWGVAPKSLIGVPWRYALRCMDELGLILRAEVIWSKLNGMPESVTDRVRRSHETWFHFTLGSKYFSSVDEIRDPYVDNASGRRPPLARNKTPRHIAAKDHSGWKAQNGTGVPHPLGALPSSVWAIPTQPLIVPVGFEDHYAAFPMEWPRRIITGWCPTGYCARCGQPRRVVVNRPGRDASRARSEMDGGHTAWAECMQRPDTITGYACACLDVTAATRPAVVLDPFGGSGTTALMADVLGRHGVSVDLSADYCRLARWRTTDPGERATAMQLAKPESVPEAQQSLF